jgi:ligand-binding SRPBCC domain-containing protein
MKKFKIVTEMWIPRPIDEVWSWGSDPKNLGKISPPLFGIRLSPEARTEKGAKFEISFHFKSMPLPLRWKVKITEVIAEGPKRLFIDEMVSGPFSLWRHEHRFEEGVSEFQSSSGMGSIKTMAPGTWLRDQVEYIPLGGVFSDLANKMIVQRQIEKLFTYRRQKIKAHFQIV